MLFVSTPSLVISFVLAIFYLANLAFYAVTKQQDAGDVVEIVSFSPENERYLQHTILLFGEDDTLKQKDSNDNRIEKTCVQDVFAGIAYQEIILQSLPYSDSPIFNAGICWKLFSRPPPTC